MNRMRRSRVIRLRVRYWGTNTIAVKSISISSSNH